MSAFPPSPIDGQVCWLTASQIFTWSAQYNAWLPPSLARAPGMDPNCRTWFLGNDTQVSSSGGWTAVMDTGVIGAPGQRWKISAALHGYTGGAANWIYARIHDGAINLCGTECVVAGDQWSKPLPMEVIYNMTAPTRFYVEAGGVAGTTNYILSWPRWGRDNLFPPTATRKFSSLTAERLV